ncbi:MAG: choloylglycine hydrolase [Clostridia bacterium]|nr:choloylglycine hydrolase [Clostridia bacterium]
MCTAISLCDPSHLFGRTLDLEYSYGEEVIIMPKWFCLEFIHEKSIFKHHAIIGIGIVSDGAPLYYDAMNEKGLTIAGLNFPQNAVYHSPKSDRYNVASFELIPWLLSRCETVGDARQLLAHTNITPDHFSSTLQSTPLHWLITDKREAITLESTAEGLIVYDNPFGVMTNNPPFPYHTTFLADHAHLSSRTPKNHLCPDIPMKRYSRGMGGIGLPGDFSSFSRFVRAVFLKNHTTPAPEKVGEIDRFFHIMDAVSIPRGCVKSEDGKDVLTVYAACADTTEGTYYFTTHENHRISAVRLADAPLDSSALFTVPLAHNEDICVLTPKQKRGKIRGNTIS